MVRIHFIVVITEKDNLFKEAWIKSVSKYNDCKVWFAYGTQSQSQSQSQSQCIYAPYPETYDNMIHKTIYALKRVPKADYIVRSNMSTLVDIPKFKTFLETRVVTTTNFFGGPFIYYNGQRPVISGTFIIMTNDIVEKIIVNYEESRYNRSDPEDIIMNCLVPTPTYTIGVPRLDYLHNMILYNKCFIGTRVFLFRFKSKDRNQDAKRMIEMIENNFTEEKSSIVKKQEEPLFQYLFDSLSLI